MKQLTNYQRVSGYLVKVFKAINTEYFEGQLETPEITIQSTIGAYGHVTTTKVWVDSKNEVARYELNVGADYLTRPIENVVATLIHEATHLYCMQNGIKDTSMNGIYHNKRFKEVAESKGKLSISKHERYGWTVTEPTENTIQFCIDNGFEDIQITRQTTYSFISIGGDKSADGHKTTKPVNRNSHSIKWVCPCCRDSVRSTKVVNIICGDCGVPFERA